MSIIFWFKEIYYAVKIKKLGTLWYDYHKDLDSLVISFLTHNPIFDQDNGNLYFNINQVKYMLHYDSYDNSVDISISNFPKKIMFFNPSIDGVVSNKTIYNLKKYIKKSNISDNLYSTFSDTTKKNGYILNLINKK